MEVRIFSCQKPVFSGKARAVYAKSPVGWFGILPRHAPASFFLQETPLRIQSESGEKVFLVKRGVLQVRENRVTVVAEEVQDG